MTGPGREIRELLSSLWLRFGALAFAMVASIHLAAKPSPAYRWASG